MARIYLASPYSDPDPLVRKNRVRLAEAKAIELMEAGNQVFSPVVYGGRMVELGCELDDAYWDEWSMSFLQKWAEVLAFYRIDGFRKSEGMTKEWVYACDHHMPIIYV